MTSVIVRADMLTVSARFRAALAEWWEKQKFQPPPAGMRRRSDAKGTNELDRVIGVRGWTSRMARGIKTRPDPEITKRACDALGVRYEWLMFGLGSMRPDTTEPDGESAIEKELRASLEANLPKHFEPIAQYLIVQGVQPEAVQLARSRGLSLTATADETEDFIVACQQEIAGRMGERVREKREERAKARAAEPAPKRRRAAG